MSRAAKHFAHRRRGVTLLELVLAVAISAVVLLLVAQAVRLQLRMVDVGRTELEETQLARAVLRRFADDLSAAVYAEPPDLTAVEDLAATGIDTAADEGLTEEETTEDLAGSLAPPDIPGLYGNRYELQVDISRLPRLDEYLPQLSDAGLARDLPSDLKTVTWYLQGAGTSGSAGEFLGTAQVAREASDNDDEANRGLFRRVMDRSATLYAVESGGLSRVNTNNEALAPEVTQVEFRYFDGAQWLSEWDSSQQGGLPMAVQVAISIRPSGADDASRLTNVVSEGPTLSANGDLIYSLTVHLPLAQPTANQQVEQGTQQGQQGTSQ